MNIVGKKVFGSNWEVGSCANKMIVCTKKCGIENLQTITEFAQLQTQTEQFVACIGKKKSCDDVGTFNKVQDDYGMVYRRFRLEIDVLSVSTDPNQKQLGEFCLSEMKTLGLMGSSLSRNKLYEKRAAHVQHLVKVIRVPGYLFATRLQSLLTELETAGELFVQTGTAKSIALDKMKKEDTASKFRAGVLQAMSQFFDYCKAMSIATKLPLWINLVSELEVIISESKKSVPNKTASGTAETGTTEKVV